MLNQRHLNKFFRSLRLNNQEKTLADLTDMSSLMFHKTVLPLKGLQAVRKITSKLSIIVFVISMHDSHVTNEEKLFLAVEITFFALVVGNLCVDCHQMSTKYDVPYKNILANRALGGLC